MPCGCEGLGGEQLCHSAACELAGGLVVLLYDVYGEAGLDLDAEGECSKVTELIANNHLHFMFPTAIFEREKQDYQTTRQNGGSPT